MKTDYHAEVLADSIAEGVRLTTIEVTFPRIVLAEFNTHRMLSRNSASSRAIPVEKRIKMVREHPFVPRAFGKNQKGMQASEELDEKASEISRLHWLSAAKDACERAECLAEIGVHKQLANRLLEPFCWHTVICTATEWDNFFALRCHPDAQPEIRIAAELMREAMAKSEPTRCRLGDWHLPLVNENDIDVPNYDLPWLSAARCARVSYLTHDGKRDVEADLMLANRLKTSGHMSPFEHPAMVANTRRPPLPQPSNFSYPWVQLRKMISGEAVFRHDREKETT